MSSSGALRRAAAGLREVEARLVGSGAGATDDEIAVLYAALDELMWRIALEVPRSTLGDVQGEAVLSHPIARSLRITQESVDGAPIGIFRLDAEGRVVTVNRQACETLGYTREELESLTVFDFDASITKERWQQHRLLTRASGARTFTTVHRRKDGKEIPVEISVKQFLFEGELFSVSFVKDVSERIAAEQERRRLEGSMLQSQKLESLGILAGGIAHDFNNLLMAILGNLEIARCEAPSLASEPSMLRDAEVAAKHAADLCRQLLIYAGKGNSRTETVDVGTLLREQAQVLEVTASKGTRLVLNLAESLPMISADVSQLRQVFMNLLLNASEAIGNSPGVVSISTSVVSCDRDCLEGFQGTQSLEPGRYLSIEVSDTGCGMDEATRQRIFDPFFSTKTAGRGLGLAAVRGIVGNHKGGILVHSELKKGTVFRLLFPVLDSLDSALPERPATHPWQGSGLVLLIDDEADLCRLGKRMLARLGFEAIVAKNGVEGLALYRENRDKIRYVLLDWTMPEMSGGETLRELRRLDPNVRVILATGHAPGDILREVGVEGVSALVLKPYSLEELAQAFRNVGAPKSESAQSLTLTD
jgi:two-component system, cell cycle sensor histidine kinase and response regulator CckA